MLNIRINNLKVINISNLGSLNIGRAILCNNRAAVYNYSGSGGADADDDGQQAAAEPQAQPDQADVTAPITTPTIIDPIV